MPACCLALCTSQDGPDWQPSPCRPPGAPATELLHLFKLPGVPTGLGLPGLPERMELGAARPGQMLEMKAPPLEMLPESSPIIGS